MLAEGKKTHNSYKVEAKRISQQKYEGHGRGVLHAQLTGSSPSLREERGLRMASCGSPCGSLLDLLLPRYIVAMEFLTATLLLLFLLCPPLGIGSKCQLRDHDHPFGQEWRSRAPSILPGHRCCCNRFQALHSFPCHEFQDWDSVLKKQKLVPGVIPYAASCHSIPSLSFSRSSYYCFPSSSFTPHAIAPTERPDRFPLSLLSLSTNRTIYKHIASCSSFLSRGC